MLTYKLDQLNLGNGVDMEELATRFAGKEDTNMRIAWIEDQMEKMDKKGPTAAGSLSTTGGSNNLDLIKRLSALEKGAEDHESRIAALESSLENLKNSLTGAEPSSGDKPSAPADMNQLSMRINLMSEELKKKADKTEVQHQASIVQSKINEVTDRIGTHQITMDDLRKALDSLRAEFDNFKNKDFQSLLDRVTTSEKKVTTLFDRRGTNDGEHHGENVDVNSGELAERVSAIEEMLKELQNQLAHSHKELQD